MSNSRSTLALQADDRPVTGSSFRFRLERVHALREHAEGVAKEELAGALIERADSERELQTVDDQIGDARSAQRDGAAVPLTATDLVGRQAYLERLELARAAAARDLSCHDQNVERRRAHVDRAMRDRKVLDRLKERRRADYDAEVARRESSMLDEVALNLYRRAAVA